MEVAELRASVPEHCFKRSFLKSFFFVVRDVALVFMVGYIYVQIGRGVVLYAIIQGTVLTGLWVIGHECGHGAFSESTLVNDIFGFIIHTGLLVPYFSWQRTHAVHHARCNHLLDGETHNPGLKKKMMNTYSKMVDSIGEDAFVLFQIVSHLLFGWIMYLTQHVTRTKSLG